MITWRQSTRVSLKGAAADEIDAGGNRDDAERRHHRMGGVTGAAQARVDQRQSRARQRSQQKEHNTRRGLDFRDRKPASSYPHPLWESNASAPPAPVPAPRHPGRPAGTRRADPPRTSNAMAASTNANPPAIIENQPLSLNFSGLATAVPLDQSITGIGGCRTSPCREQALMQLMTSF